MASWFRILFFHYNYFTAVFPLYLLLIIFLNDIFSNEIKYFYIFSFYIFILKIYQNYIKFIKKRGPWFDLDLANYFYKNNISYIRQRSYFLQDDKENNVFMYFKSDQNSKVELGIKRILDYSLNNFESNVWENVLDFEKNFGKISSRFCLIIVVFYLYCNILLKNENYYITVYNNINISFFLITSILGFFLIMLLIMLNNNFYNDLTKNQENKYGMPKIIDIEQAIISKKIKFGCLSEASFDKDNKFLLSGNDKHVLIVVADPSDSNFLLILGFLTSAKQENNIELSLINYDGENKTQLFHCSKRINRISKNFFEEKNHINEYIKKDNDLIYNKIVKKLQENLGKLATLEIVETSLITRYDFINYVKKSIDNLITEITNEFCKKELKSKSNPENFDEKSKKKERDYYRNLVLDETSQINNKIKTIVKFYLNIYDLREIDKIEKTRQYNENNEDNKNNDD